jgi:hypothetical protein
MRNVLDKVVEKIKTHTSCSLNFFRKSRRLGDNVEKSGRDRQARDDNTIRCMRSACCIPKATNTHSEDVILIAFTLQQWVDKRAKMLRYSTLAVLFKSGLVEYY